MDPSIIYMQYDIESQSDVESNVAICIYDRQYDVKNSFLISSLHLNGHDKSF